MSTTPRPASVARPLPGVARIAPGVLFAFLLAAPSRGKEVAGVTFPDSLEVQGKVLKLSGMGLRTRFFFKVYVAGLYVEKPCRDSEAVIASDELKRVQLSFLRKLDGTQISSAIVEAFERKSPERKVGLKARLERLKTMLTAVEPGDQFLFTYVPGKGLQVTVKGSEKGIIEGKDFAEAFFSVWLGPEAADARLRKALLGE